MTTIILTYGQSNLQKQLCCLRINVRIMVCAVMLDNMIENMRHTFNTSTIQHQELTGRSLHIFQVYLLSHYTAPGSKTIYHPQFSIPDPNSFVENKFLDPNAPAPNPRPPKKTWTQPVLQNYKKFQSCVFKSFHQYFMSKTVKIKKMIYKC